MFSVSTVSKQSELNRSCTDLSVSLFISGLGDRAANRLCQMHSGTFCGIGLQTVTIIFKIWSHFWSINSTRDELGATETEGFPPCLISLEKLCDLSVRRLAILSHM